MCVPCELYACAVSYVCVLISYVCTHQLRVCTHQLRVCSRCKPQPNAQGLPVGGYLNSCLGCVQEGDTVQCAACGKADGQQQSTQYKLSQCPHPGRLDNNNGVLTCIDLPNEHGIPKGRTNTSYTRAALY